MRVNYALAIIVAAAGLFGAPEVSRAQNAPAAPPLKTIGVPSSVKAQIVPSLIVGV